MKKIVKISSAVILSAILFSGCETEPKPEPVPTATTMQNQTVYSSVLPHLNDMIKVFRNAPISIFVADITNDTGARGKLPANINVITKTTLTKIGDFVTVINNPDVSEEVKQNAYVLAGAITEFDVISTKTKGGNAALTGTVGKRHNEWNSDISMDAEDQTVKLTINFLPASVDTGNYIPLTSTSNTITIEKKSNANEFAFAILGSGFGFNSAVTKTNGIHSSITALVELSIAEVLGKLGKFPYWLLTKGGKPDSNVVKVLTKNFLREPLNKRIEQISYLLALHGKDVEVTRLMNDKLKKAIIEYKSEHGLPANDTLSKDFYVALLKP